MRRIGVVLIGLAVLFLQAASVRAEDTVDALEKDLQDLQETHQQTTAQQMSDFLSQTLSASQSSDAALQLYSDSHGWMPNGAPVLTQHARETSSEKAARESRDASTLGNLALVAQLHCGMLHYAALYVTTPEKNQKEVHDEWIAWLKSTMPPIFSQLKDDDLKPTKMLMHMTMKDSVISAAFNITAWGNKEQGAWTVGDLPGFYRAQILEPLRAAPNADILVAWDTYIALRSAVQPDQDKWTTAEYPALMFDRDTDDYKGSPSMEKLQTLVELIKANPHCPTLDTMISRMHDLVKDYRQRHPGAAGPQGGTATAANTPADPNVKVTTTKDGDMTIIVSVQRGAS